MNFKEKLIEFVVCTTVIFLSLYFIFNSFNKGFQKQPYISNGIIIDKVHIEDYTDTIFITDANGITSMYTNYYEEEFIFKIVKDGIENSCVVKKSTFNTYEIGDMYYRE